jgi:hypothetical protein
MATIGKGTGVTSQTSNMAREMNPLITVAHVPDTGHHVRFENYDVYLATVKTFLAQMQEEA